MSGFQRDLDLHNLILKWKQFVHNSHFPDQHIRDNTIDPLVNLFYLLTQSARVINSAKTKQITNDLDDRLGFLVNGSLSLGVEYKQQNFDVFINSEDDIPTEALSKIMASIIPAYDVAKRLIDISHAPGRLIILEENKSQVISETEKALLTAAKRLFVEGSKLGGRSSPFKPSEKLQSEPYVGMPWYYWLLIIGFVVVVIGGLIYLSGDSDMGSQSLSSRPTKISATTTPRVVAIDENETTPSMGTSSEYVLKKATATPECYHWSLVTQQQVGKIICVYGDIARWYTTDEFATVIRFSENPEDFIMVDREYTYPEVKPGSCVRTIGQIYTLGERIVLLIEDGLYYCNP